MGGSGRPSHDAHISDSRYGAPGFLRSLKEVVADEFECVLTSPPANALAVAEEMELFDVSCVGVGERDVDEADGLVGVGARSAGTRAGDAGDRDAERCSGAGADAFGEGACYFG